MGKTDMDTLPSFSIKLYSKLSQQQGNLFLSPYSIHTALGMCAAGAKGDTRKALCDLLGCPHNTNEHNAYFQALIAGVNGAGGERPYELVTANRLWGDRSYKFNETFLNDIKEFFSGGLTDVDYVNNPQGAVDAINTWVSDKTKSLIPTIIKIDDVNNDTRLVLTNAIYFKGKWENAFDKARTQSDYFFGTKGAKRVPLMHNNCNQMYYETHGFKAVDLPYKGDELSMMVVLPDVDTFKDFEKNWSDSLYEKVCHGLYQESKVRLYLPRFKMSAEFKLKSVLGSMGMSLAFSDDADFTGIGPDRLKISEVIHKAFVECDEEGTKAAAATAVTTVRCASMRMDEPKEFRADHPFLFSIRNKKTGTVLFTGRLLDVPE